MLTEKIKKDSLEVSNIRIGTTERKKTYLSRFIGNKFSEVFYEKIRFDCFMKSTHGTEFPPFVTVHLSQRNF